MGPNTDEVTFRDLVDDTGTRLATRLTLRLVEVSEHFEIVLWLLKRPTDCDEALLR